MIHWFDLCAIIFLFGSTVWSYYRGFTQESFWILALVAGYFAASAFYHPAAPLLANVIEEPVARQIGAFLLLFFGVVMLVVVAGVYVRRALKVSETLTVMDRVAGAAIGLIKGGVILSLMAYFAQGAGFDLAKMTATGPFLVSLSAVIVENTAPGLAKNIDTTRQGAGKVREKLNAAEQLKKNFDILTGSQPDGKQEKRSADPSRKPAPSTPSGPSKEAKPAPDTGISDDDRREMDDLLNRLDR